MILNEQWKSGGFLSSVLSFAVMPNFVQQMEIFYNILKQNENCIGLFSKHLI